MPKNVLCLNGGISGFPCVRKHDIPSFCLKVHRVPSPNHLGFSSARYQHEKVVLKAAPPAVLYVGSHEASERTRGMSAGFCLCRGYHSTGETGARLQRQ